MTFGVEPRKLFLLVVGALLCCTAVRARPKMASTWFESMARLALLTSMERLSLSLRSMMGESSKAGIAP